MTMTQADWSALEQAQQQGGTTYLEALQQQQAQALSGVPGGVGGGSAPGAPGASTSTSVGQDAIDSVEQAYPDLAWMLNVPELGSLIVTAASSGESADTLNAQLQQTGWWQTHGDSVRNWLQEVETDPGQAQSDMQAQKSSLEATMAAMGLQPTPDQLALLASQSLALGWTDQEIKDNISQNVTAGANGSFSFNYAGVTSGSSAAGSLTASVDSIQAEAGKYLVPISGSTATAFSQALADGHMTMDSVDAYLQQQAESLYPSITGAIQQGITPSDYVTPYKEVAAQLLGVDPSSIDMTQAKWNRPLSNPGPNGVPTAMSLYDWQQTLMTDPQYNYTNSVNAKDRASSIAQGVAEMFGKTATGPTGTSGFNDAAAPTITGVPIT